jgi:hypothetical protein
MIRGHLIWSIAIFLLLGGCASHKDVPMTGPRPPTSADQVKIYQTIPATFERLGRVSVAVTPEIKWDANGEAVLGFDRLKAAAAQRGANGLLLDLDKESSDFLVGVSYHGQSFQVPIKNNPKTAIAEAIYVIEE